MHENCEAWLFLLPESLITDPQPHSENQNPLPPKHTHPPCPICRDFSSVSWPPCDTAFLPQICPDFISLFGDLSWSATSSSAVLVVTQCSLNTIQFLWTLPPPGILTSFCVDLCLLLFLEQNTRTEKEERVGFTYFFQCNTAPSLAHGVCSDSCYIRLSILLQFYLHNTLYKINNTAQTAR